MVKDSGGSSPNASVCSNGMESLSSPITTSTLLRGTL
ncbi:MAG: hypothetical protein DRH70_05945 [Candidatus Coatesbacteria bacterium]|nr:MAG: hypothetical protein DRH70_05945 [Candidatus Coatesbacteria bacterium]